MRLQASLILILLTGPVAWAQTVRDFPPPRRVATSETTANANAENWYPTGHKLARPVPASTKAAPAFPAAGESQGTSDEVTVNWWNEYQANKTSAIQQVAHQEVQPVAHPEMVPGIPAVPVPNGPSSPPRQSPSLDAVPGSFPFPAPQRQLMTTMPLPETPPTPPSRLLAPPPTWNTTGTSTPPTLESQNPGDLTLQVAPVLPVDSNMQVYAPPSFPSPFRGDAMQMAMYPEDPMLAPPPLWQGEMQCDSFGCDYAPGFSGSGGIDRLFNRDGHGWFMPFIELQLYGGNERTIGKGDVFVPLWQTNERLVFFDMKGEFDDHDAGEGTWGFGYRRMFDTMWIFGLYGYWDVLHSSHGNDFTTGTLGFEFLTVNWDFRLNGYIPSGGEGYAPATSALSNGSVVTRNFVEKTYGGFDFEAGYRVGNWGANDNVELRWFLGGFVYDASGPNYPSMVGPKTRVELRIYDLDILGYQARLEGGAEFTWDDVRNEQTFGFVRVRIPLGSHARDRLGPLRRRMVDLPTHNID